MSEKDNLDSLLDLWDDVPAVDPQLKHHVWSRIASGDGRSESPFKWWLLGLSTTFSRPLVATAFVATCIACGVLIAEFRVSKLRQARSQELARNYIEMIESQDLSFVMEEAP